jgi:hypothetical protein
MNCVNMGLRGGTVKRKTSFIELMELSHRFNWLHLGIAAAKRVTENSIYYCNLIFCCARKN